MAMAHLGLGSTAPTFPSYSLPALHSLPPSRLVRLCPPPLAANIWMRVQVRAASEAHLSSEMSVLISSLLILREIKKMQRGIHSCFSGFHPIENKCLIVNIFLKLETLGF